MPTNMFDYTFSSLERLSYTGKMYRLGTERLVLAAAGDYGAICFTTPASLLPIYRYAVIAKSGSELNVTLVEDCTYSGGIAVTPWNLNRYYRDDPSPLLDTRSGMSIGISALSITGGLSAPSKMIPGDAGGNLMPGDSSEIYGYLLLLPDTKYAMKCTAVGGEVHMSAILDIACIRREARE